MEQILQISKDQIAQKKAQSQNKKILPQKNVKKPKKQKQNKEQRCYHHILISKLSSAFEKQFFSHFEDIMQEKQDGTTQVYQADSLTITKSKQNYDGVKNAAMDSVQKVTTKGLICLSIFLFYTVLFSFGRVLQEQPWLIWLSLKLSKVDNTLNQALWVIICSAATMFLIFIAAVQIIFFKIRTKVNTIKFLRRSLYFLLLALVATGAVDLVFGIFCLKNQEAIVIVGFVILLIIQYGILAIIFITSEKDAKICEQDLILFHDYLINYRQTPRSKLLKKHLPGLDAVVEVDSQFERSELDISERTQMMKSSQRLHDTNNPLALSTPSSKKLKFKFSEEQEVKIPVESSSSSESDDGGFEMDLELNSLELEETQQGYRQSLNPDSFARDAASSDYFNRDAQEKLLTQSQDSITRERTITVQQKSSLSMF